MEPRPFRSASPTTAVLTRSTYILYICLSSRAGSTRHTQSSQSPYDLWLHGKLTKTWSNFDLFVPGWPSAIEPISGEKHHRNGPEQPLNNKPPSNTKIHPGVSLTQQKFYFSQNIIQHSISIILPSYNMILDQLVQGYYSKQFSVAVLITPNMLFTKEKL